MADWVTLNDIDARLREERSDGIVIRYFVSPFDVPEAVRGNYDKDRGTFTIEFRYSSSEPSKTLTVSGHDDVRFLVGKTSNRLLGLEVAVQKLKVSEVALEVAVMASLRDALRLLADKVPRHRKQGFDLARDVIEEKSPELLQELSPAG